MPTQLPTPPLPGQPWPDEDSLAARYFRGELSPEQYRQAFYAERRDALTLARTRAAAGGHECLGCGKPAPKSALGQFCSPACANRVWELEATAARDSLGRQLDEYDAKVAK